MDTVTIEGGLSLPLHHSYNIESQCFPVDKNISFPLHNNNGSLPLHNNNGSIIDTGCTVPINSLIIQPQETIQSCIHCPTAQTEIYNNNQWCYVNSDLSSQLPSPSHIPLNITLPSSINNNVNLIKLPSSNISREILSMNGQVSNDKGSIIDFNSWKYISPMEPPVPLQYPKDCFRPHKRNQDKEM